MNNKNYFNFPRYKELVKFEASDKNLYSLLDEKNLELLTYRASVTNQINYDRKKDYFLLIHKYLTRLILPYEFRGQFLQMEKEDSKKAARILEDFQQLEVFSLAKDLDEFSDLMGQISDLCFDFTEYWDGTIPLMTENEFYELINNRYLQLQKIFPSNFLEISWKNQNYNHLVSRSFNFLIFILGLEILLILFSINTIK